MSTLVTVDPTSAKAPILTQGDISLVLMMDFENAALVEIYPSGKG